MYPIEKFKQIVVHKRKRKMILRKSQEAVILKKVKKEQDFGRFCFTQTNFDYRKSLNTAQNPQKN